MRVKDFNLQQTLECGQCFNFEKLDDQEYIVLAKGRMLHVAQEKDDLIFLNAEEKDIQEIWIPYFDLKRDYGIIKKAIVKADKRLKEVIDEYYGIRILNQDFEETLISFIISQNKNITHIKQIIRLISENHGDRVGEISVEGNIRNFYSFPDLEELKDISEEEFRRLKTGFRAPYLTDAIDKMVSGELKSEELARSSFSDAKEKLMTIRGVGDKVANCVLLFSLGFHNAFPVDVWIKRIMEELYFQESTDIKVIEQFAAEKFGRFGGYAQQYLFIYAKEKSKK